MALKIPPHNEEAEASVLGGILLNKDAINIVSEILSPSDFYEDANAIIYSTMLSLSEEGKPIDVLTVGSLLKKNKKSDKVDPSYLADLVNSVPTAANIEEYAHLIKEASVRRSLINLGGEIAEMSFEEDKDIKALLDKTESSVFGISKGQSLRGFRPVKDALAESFDRIDELHNKGAGLRGVETGFTDLDNILSGMQSSNLLILAARPGQGKTAMMINIAQHIAVVN
ncbi:MAG: DnaB-like helicase N-terminal domain-containing protein, partial [Patescibacteria group bacterium]